MDTLNIMQKTNATFVWTFGLDAWCDLYDFSLGHWHSMLRKQVESHIALYEWSTENGRIEYAETYAHGEIAFTVNPGPGQVVIIGSRTVVFGSDVAVGASLAGTLANLLAWLQLSTDTDILHCTYSVTAGSALNIVYATTGGLGNVFPFDTNAAGTTKSGDTLSGGGGMLTMLAPVTHIETFAGDYFYDVRFQYVTSDETVYVPVVGGMITFEPGVTRHRNMTDVIVTPSLADAVTAARLHAQRAELAQAAAVTAASTAVNAAGNVYLSMNYGILGSDPTTRPDGTPPQNGDQYYNSSAHALKIRVDGAWAVTSLAATVGVAPMLGANNLSDVSSTSQSRINLGLGTAAVLNAGAAGGAATLDGSGKLPASQFNAAITGALAAASNLSDLANTATARTNLGLGTAATATAGAAGGVASLDGGGKVPIAQIPAGTASGVASLDVSGHVPLTQMNAGAANGIAQLDSGGIVPLAQLPAFGSPTTNAKSANYTTVSGDQGKVIYVTTGSSADVSITFVAATTAGDGAVMIVAKADSGTNKVIVLDSNGTTQMAWLSNQYDTVAFRSSGGAWTRYWKRIVPRVETFTANGTWTKPPFAEMVFVALQGPGGGGAGAGTGNGNGGGGGARAEIWFNAADLSSTETVTVPTGGNGGANNNNGSDAAATSFGTTVRVLAGGGFGGSSVTGGGGSVGGLPPTTAAPSGTPGTGFNGGGVPTSTTTAGAGAVYGGGSGGSGGGSVGGAGGSSMFGGGGGGAGGSGGGAGGRRGSVTAGGGATAGASGGSLGVGGGGGSGGLGGAGGVGAGGGGGGGSGAGGAGGRGEASITTVF